MKYSIVMTKTEAEQLQSKYIDKMEEDSSISYVAIVKIASNNYGVEYGTTEKKIRTITNFFKKAFSEDTLNEEITNSNFGSLLSGSKDYFKMKEYIRPVKAGTSISDCTSVFKSGTLGILLSFQNNNKIYGLTNMHVASFYHSKEENTTITIESKHQKITQPSNIDKSQFQYDKSNTIIGRSVWKAFNTKIDAALIELNTITVSQGFFNSPIKNTDEFNTGIAQIGEDSKKQGRSSCYTSGEILSDNAAVKVKNYFSDINGLGESIIFTDQIMTKKMAESGDSGSVLISGNKVIGLTFAGINFKNKRGRTFHNKIGNVLKNIEIEDEDNKKISPKLNQFIV